MRSLLFLAYRYDSVSGERGEVIAPSTKARLAAATSEAACASACDWRASSRPLSAIVAAVIVPRPFS